MPSDSEILNRRGKWFAGLTLIFLCSCFIVSPLGGFFIWITIGCTAYSAFYSVYNFVLASKDAIAPRRQQEIEQQQELKTYVRRHLTILISMFLVTLLLVIIFWMFFI
jgi:hypothetical protein